MGRAFLLLLCLLSPLLGACQLESDKPLLVAPAKNATLGGDVVAALQDAKGSLVDRDGKIQIYHLTFKDGWYDAVDDPKSAGLRLSFIPSFDTPFNYVMQFSQDGKIAYMAALIDGGFVYLKNMVPNAEVEAALRKDGVTLGTRDMSRVVATAVDLKKTIKAWAEANYVDLLDPSKYLLKFRIARDDATANDLSADIKVDLCLAVAGHPLDLAVRKLPGALSRGVPIESIDEKVALERCAFASDIHAANSAQFALVRALYKAKRYAEAKPTIDWLVKMDFPLVYLLQADDLSRGLSGKADPDAALRLLDRQAIGEPVVAYVAGLMHLNRAMQFSGSLDEEDYDDEAWEYQDARRLLQGAATDGIAEAYTALGNAHAAGQSLFPARPTLAAQLYEKAGELGDPAGSLAAGKAYYFGTGVEKDYGKAFKLMVPAADMGLSEAQYMRGFMTAYGQGTIKSEADAVAWLRKATNAGSSQAKVELGRMIYNGLGTQADPETGRRMLEEEQKSGNKRAGEYLTAIVKPATPAVDASVPEGIRADMDKLASGGPFRLTNENMAFMGGMAKQLTEVCGLPEDLSERAELAGLAMNAQSSLLGGNDYSNPDIMKGVGNMLSSNMLLMAGIKFAEQMSCDGDAAKAIAGRLAQASASNKSGADGGSAPFVPSCTPHFDAQRCACLAQVGRGAVPDIYQRTYQREVIKEIISRNPLLALTMAMSCQIGEY